MLSEYLPLVIFGLVAIAVGVGGLLFSSLMGPKAHKTRSKYNTYECGVDPLDKAPRPVAVKFYTFALLFILFDIETIFLLPWAINFRASIGTGTLPAVLFFLAILIVGLVYIIKTKTLDTE